MMSVSNAMPSLSALAHEANHGLDICKKETTVEHHAGCSCDTKELAAGGLCTLGSQECQSKLEASPSGQSGTGSVALTPSFSLLLARHGLRREVCCGCSF